METTPTDALLVKRLVPEATLPKCASPGDAGYDLSAAADQSIASGSWGLVRTGISIAVPEGTYGRVAPRSGLAIKNGIVVGAGVVDRSYRGEVGVVLFNHGPGTFQVRKGDRIAQLILEKIASPPVVEVESLSVTHRGAGGFGSTGV
ncbi:dUTPase [Klebsormidium nitens]|uniref:Deoxyuridine 5'-triphosphate nucleotidohydrolase n=1 Tax=Klebsormidium nitens TaxID=105231 RepID=A0A1Y1IVJ2_KLENI|nr:dUTPase [Klebsormidium nitens]|eukprot:GAQ92886.1 dUTPase [Klebsormidium nitens]